MDAPLAAARSSASFRAFLRPVLMFAGPLWDEDPSTIPTDSQPAICCGASTQRI
jgi:hypothetical protein